jgi:Zn-finger nucleic acid-binding protein
MPRICPRCGDNLEERTFGDVKLDGCSGCGGIWFDSQELNQLTRDPSVGLMEIERAFNPAVFGGGAAGRMLCPKCAQPLSPFSFSHTPEVGLDICRQCKGVWLDDGEMQKIAERIAASRPRSEPQTASVRTIQDQARTCIGFLLSAPCPACGTTNPASALACWACGKAIKTRSLLRLCPRCNRSMDSTAFGEQTSVETCLRCGGVWFEAGELSVFFQLGPSVIDDVGHKITAAGAGPRPFDEVPNTLKCPGCHYSMESRIFGADTALKIETCTYCSSVWLDAGELSAAYEYMQGGGVITTDKSGADPWGDG